jgi:hypothetical protein
MRATLMHTGVAADDARRLSSVQTIHHVILETELLHCALRVGVSIGREGDNTRVQLTELGQVLLEVGQLPTAVTSPVPAIEHENCGRSLKSVRDDEPCARDSLPADKGETLSNLKRFHLLLRQPVSSAASSMRSRVRCPPERSGRNTPLLLYPVA